MSRSYSSASSASLLGELAARKLRDWRRRRAEALGSAPLESCSLQEFIPRATPGYQSPTHLSPLTEVLERARTERIRAVVHAPPRHGKTETIEHWVAQELKRDPRLKFGYVSYQADLAHSKSKEIRDIAERVGVHLGGIQRLADWQTTAGGGVYSTGIGGALTGRGLNRLVIDDPVKNRVEAESSTLRARTWGWYTSTARTRLEPGASIVVVMTRWHEDDLAGRLLDRRKFTSIALPALDDAGRALWTERYDLEALAELREDIGEYDWASLFQGAPMPRGAGVFEDCTYYDELPEEGYRVALGVDLAYAARTKSDWSVIIVLRRCAGLFYVEAVHRMQVPSHQFKARLRVVQDEYPGAGCRWYAYGAEKGVADFITETEPRCKLEVIAASGDKFVRAQPAAAAWAAGKILVPRDAPWVGRFLSELMVFTGSGDDANDDQVDGLAAAYDLLKPSGAGERLRAFARAGGAKNLASVAQRRAAKA